MDAFRQAHKRAGEESLMLGVMPGNPGLWFEVFRSVAPEGGGFTAVIRDNNLDEVCIMTSGTQLLPTRYFTEKGL